MPVYEYVCPDCGKEFEKTVSVERRYYIYCPDCGTLANKRFSTPTIVYDFPTLDSIDIMNKEGKYNY